MKKVISEIEFPDGTIAELEHQEGLSQSDITNKLLNKNPDLFQKYPEFKTKYQNVYNKFKPKSEVFTDILKDVGKSVLDVPKELAEGIYNLPTQLYRSGKAIVQDPKQSIEELSIAIPQTLKSVGNITPNVLNYLKSKGLDIEGKGNYEPYKPYFEDNPFEKMVKERASQSPEHESLLGVSQLIPSLALRSVPVVGQALGNFADVSTSVQNKQNPLTVLAGAQAPKIIGKGMESSLNLASNVFDRIKNLKQNPLSPSNIGISGISRSFGKNLPIDTLKENLELSKGTRLPLGNVIDSPYLKGVFDEGTYSNYTGGPDLRRSISEQFENKMLKNIEKTRPKKFDPFLSEKISKEIIKPKKIEEIPLKQLPTDTNELMLKRLKEREKDINETSKKLYEKRTEQEKKEGFKIKDIDNSIKEFRTSKSDIQDFVSGLDDKHMVTFEKLDNYLKNKSKNLGASITEIQDLNSLISEEAKSLQRSNEPINRRQGKRLERFSTSLRKDLKDNIDKYGSQELKQKQLEADEYFKNNKAYLNKKFIRTVLKDEEKGRSIAPMSLTSKTLDNPSKLEYLKKIDPELPKMAGLNYLKDYFKDGIFDIEGAKKSIDKLGPRTKNMIFDEEFLNTVNKNFKNKEINDFVSEQAKKTDIYKLTQKSKDPRSFAKDIVDPDKIYGDGKILDEVNKLISKDDFKSIGYLYLQNAIDESGKLNTKKLSKLVQSLSDDQLNKLFKEKEILETVKEIPKIEKLSNIDKEKFYNSSIFSRTFNKITGYYVPKTIINKLTDPEIIKKVVNKKIEIKEGQYRRNIGKSTQRDLGLKFKDKDFRNKFLNKNRFELNLPKFNVITKKEEDKKK